MTISAIHHSAFYKELADYKKVWTIKDSGGFPAPKNSEGVRSQPFWSKRSRAEKIIATVPAYAEFEPVEISIEEFKTRWLPNLERDGFKVGLNWSGDRAVGVDIDPAQVLEIIERTDEKY